MIDGPEFDRRLFAWLDGELPADQAAEMEAWCAAHPDARVRTDAERAFDERVKRALLSGTSGREVVSAALATAQATPVAAPAPVAQPTASPARGRLVRFPRWATGAAAAVLVAVGAMWINCIPPFECAYVQALEAAVDTPGTRSDVYEGIEGERVPVSLSGCCELWRADVPVGGGTACLLYCPDFDDEPSFRRRRDIDGAPWWVADENGRTLVMFRTAKCRGLWCFAGRQDEETLIAAARSFRAKRAGADK